MRGAASCLVILLPALASFAPANAEPVDLELILAVDVSGSIDPEEALLQREGYKAAITNPLLVSAIASGITGSIALTYLEWADVSHQRTIVDWMRIDSAASAQRFADALRGPPAINARRTSISAALSHAVTLFDDNGFESPRRVIDVSGDGPNNSGDRVDVMRDSAVALGITINGLPVVNDRPNIFGLPTMPDLDRYYADCVVGGSGAFIVVAESYDDFSEAILQKMLLEVASHQPPRPLFLLAATEQTPVDCLIGERRHRELFGQ